MYSTSKEAEKILKYKDLTIELQRMWSIKTKVIPIIIRATGTISKTFRKYMSNVPGNHEVKELQKTAILGAAHIIIIIIILFISFPFIIYRSISTSESTNVKVQ